MGKTVVIAAIVSIAMIAIVFNVTSLRTAIAAS